MRRSLEQVTRDMLSGIDEWPGPVLCMKKRGQFELRGMGVLFSDVNGKFTIVNHRDGMSQQFKETYDSPDAVLAAGWVVD